MDNFSVFRLSTIQKNILIISTSILILSYVLISQAFLFIPGEKVPMTLNAIITVVFLCGFSVIYFTLYRFYSHYGIKLLAYFSMFMLVLEAFTQLTDLIGFFFATLPEEISVITLSISGFAQIAFIILIIMQPALSFPGFRSLKHFAMNQVWAIVLSLALTMFLSSKGYGQYGHLAFLPFAIPYIFIIQFALRVTAKNEPGLN